MVEHTCNSNSERRLRQENLKLQARASLGCTWGGISP